MKKPIIIAIVIAMGLISIPISYACTGITLKTVDKKNIVARTMEWGTFFLDSKLTVIPRNYPYVGSTPDGNNGKKWNSKYGVLGISFTDEIIILEGMNEAGLSLGTFYFPGYASYEPYNKRNSRKSLSVTQLGSYILSQFATVDEVKNGLKNISVNGQKLEVLGIIPPAHWRVVDKKGNCMIIEYTNNGRLDIYDSKTGVFTNAPTYDWHMTNLNNYVNLRVGSASPINVRGVELKPFGAGSGLLGIPGDFTPPSRFVRAVALSSTTPPLKDAYAGMNQAFTILNNFEIPIGVMYSKGKATDIPSETQWTSVSNVSDLLFYYTTNYNRQIRMVDLKKIKFDGNKTTSRPLDLELKQNIEIVNM